MDKDIQSRLKRVIERETERCMGGEGGQLSEERARLKKRYLGYGYQNDDEREERGLATYVDRTVLETVEWAKPGLMRVFCGDEIIRFDPRTPEQEQDASDATTYVNQVIFQRNMFRLVHDVLADGLSQRVGWALAHCPKKTERRVLQYAGLTEPEALALLQDPSISLDDPEAVQIARRATPLGVIYDLTVRQDVETREIAVEPIPSERVIVSADAADVEHARFVAHWEVKTASDLRRDGYSQEVVDELPLLDQEDEMPETVVGRRVNDENADSEDPGTASATGEYRIHEAWFDFDLNGDGVAEKVKVTYCGEGAACRVLKWEEWPLYRAPLFAACSVPLPHQVVGLCLADLVADLQDLRSELTRQYLDNLALSNQGELVVNEGQNGDVEYDSLMAR
ncbi:MAG: hypothetical protein II737_04985, partial [Mailhella sp.]|nr:hypothetical protein [Mailhella sp.]